MSILSRLVVSLRDCQRQAAMIFPAHPILVRQLFSRRR
jgi:hypothetical protein